jgi:hypothetical protein
LPADQGAPTTKAEAWPKLPEAIRNAMLALAESGE